jgi:hypothetical protein
MSLFFEIGNPPLVGCPVKMKSIACKFFVQTGLVIQEEGKQVDKSYACGNGYLL